MCIITFHRSSLTAATSVVACFQRDHLPPTALPDRFGLHTAYIPAGIHLFIMASLDDNSLVRKRICYGHACYPVGIPGFQHNRHCRRRWVRDWAPLCENDRRLGQEARRFGRVVITKCILEACLIHLMLVC